MFFENQGKNIWKYIYYSRIKISKKPIDTYGRLQYYNIGNINPDDIKIIP
jgi:hypothetical protein